MNIGDHQQITDDQLPAVTVNHRSEALAARLEAGATALAAFAITLSEKQWQARVPRDGRKVGVVVHHAASKYPIEIQLAQLIAAGRPIVGITWDAVDAINRDHEERNDDVTKQDALALLARNSAFAAHAIRDLSDYELDRAAPASLNSDALITCQFFLEDHAVSHSNHHLAGIRAAVARDYTLGCPTFAGMVVERIWEAPAA